MAVKIIEKLFQQPAKDFVEHLNIADNQRIIFSGRFGIGKTTFLRDYFFTESTKNLDGNNRNDYNVVHIFPVNYSIAKNEDIFRYIKYDILIEMLKQSISVDDVSLDFAQTLPFFLKKNAIDIAATFLKMIPMVGKEIGEFAKEAKKLVDKFKSFHSSITESNGDQLVGYMEKIEVEQGSIYEQDVVTKIIEQELEKLKDNVGEKRENVLVIDDLDRIDPEHIFRILNVFAAHFDRPGKLGNKFGFDKIILVCDINNIRQIFRAKYGQYVDFNGYIDKFYSNHIFEFKSYAYFRNFVFQAIWDITVSDVRTRPFELYVRSNKLLVLLLDWMVLHAEIDLRNILKLDGAIIRSRSFTIGNREISGEQEEIIWTLKILCLIKGDYSSLIDSLKKNHDWPPSWSKKQLREILALLLDLQSAANNSEDKSGNSEITVFFREKERYHLARNQNHVTIEKLHGPTGTPAPIDNLDEFLQSEIIQTILLLRRLDML